LPRGGDATSASGRAIVGRQSDRVKMTSTVEQHGGGGMVLLSASWWMKMIVDGKGGAEVRCRESHEDHRPREYVSRSHGRASWHVETASCP
jgi:hypothetical protein